MGDAMRALNIRKTLRRVLQATGALGLVVGGAVSVAAQDISSPGGNWSGGWGFSSVGEESLRLQQAQAMLAARNAGKPTSVTTYDNRQNYQELTVAAGATSSSDFQVGDDTNTAYSVGALNTGTTDITVTGDNNAVDSTIRADSDGCIDGSLALVNSGVPNLDASFDIDISSDASVQGVTCQ